MHAMTMPMINRVWLRESVGGTMHRASNTPPPPSPSTTISVLLGGLRQEQLKKRVKLPPAMMAPVAHEMAGQAVAATD